MCGGGATARRRMVCSFSNMKTPHQFANPLVARPDRLSMVVRKSAEVERIEIVLARKRAASISGRLFDTDTGVVSSYTPKKERELMELGMIGLGRMGANMTERLIRAGHRVVVSDIDSKAIDRVAALGAIGTPSIEALAGQLKAPRAIWIMVPSGQVTEKTLNTVSSFVQKGDTVIDGGNSNYKDSMRRAASLEAKGIHFVDSGTSGGIWGL